MKNALIKKDISDGSLPLKNIRHEAFCQHYAGDCFGYAADAYQKAGYKVTNISSQVNGCRLLSYANISERIKYLRQENEKKLGFDRLKACEILAEIARGKLQDFVKKDGTIEIHDVPHERAIQEFITQYDKDGNLTKKIKLRDPVAAIQVLSKILGFEVPQEHLHSLHITFGGRKDGTAE